MLSKRHVILVLMPLLSIASGAPAAAQDLTEAETLFNEGVAQMIAGHYDIACPAIAESQRIDPRAGTLFTLADCQAKWGKIATAVALYDEYLRAVSQMTPAQKVRHGKRGKVAVDQKSALEPQIPQLTLVLPASAPEDVRVTLDGIELTAASLGIAVGLDPGEYVVTTQSGHAPAVERRITLVKGEKKLVQLEVRTPEKEPVRAAKAKVKVKVAAPPAAGAAGADQGMSSHRIGAFVGAGIGIGALAFSGIMGGVALSNKSTVDANCVGGICNAEGKTAADRVRTQGLVSTIGFGFGAVGIAAGLGLFLTEPRAPEAANPKRKVTASVLGVGPDGAAIGVKGVW